MSEPDKISDPFWGTVQVPVRELPCACSCHPGDPCGRCCGEPERREAEAFWADVPSRE